MNPYSSNFLKLLENEFERETSNKKKPLKVYQKKKQENIDDPYTYNTPIEQRNQNECASLFYKLYHSGDQRYINFFKIMKKKLLEFGVIIKNKKKRDEAYLIILEKFFEELIGNFYRQGETRKSKKIFIEIFCNDFNINIQDNEWAQFMGILDQIFVEYCDIIETEIDEVSEQKLLFNLDKIQQQKLQYQ